LARKILDLFAGAGGMALGFKAAGGHCLGAVEWDASAARTFGNTFADENPIVFGGPEQGDVNNLPVEELLGGLRDSPDLVVGGPPCQGFSRIGRAKQRSLLGEEERILQGGVRNPGRNLLYQYFLAVVRQARPQAFVMENVPGMREHIGSDFAHRISREANYLGYNVRYFLLNASWYGVPQHRWRLFFVGLRSDLGHNAVPTPPVRTHQAESSLEAASLPEDPWLIAGHGVPTNKNPLPAVSVREAIGDLPRLKSHLTEGPPSELKLPLAKTPSEYVRQLRTWPALEAPDLLSGNWYRYTSRDFETFRRMAQGDRYPEALCIANERFDEHLATLSSPPRAGTEEWEALKKEFVPPYRNDAFHDKWRKFVATEPSWTVTAHLSRDTYSHIHYDSRQARTITIREAARLQSFPDAIEFQGNFGDQYRQIGNAVPPLLSRAIATNLLTQLDELDAQKKKQAAE